MAAHLSMYGYSYKCRKSRERVVAEPVVCIDRLARRVELSRPKTSSHACKLTRPGGHALASRNVR
ncbi:hypothetical protein CGCVW01_v003339 [Colletotrichum viniferum]|nr:hypothetical protein CGCVW01_v003339 [Colletotrichum viniferum]